MFLFTLHIYLTYTTTAKARYDAASWARGINHTFNVGDKVSFFIPPTAREAEEELGRKAKHIQHFKGPATVTAKLSPTTFVIVYQGTTYYGRCSSELKPYRSEDTPWLVTAAHVHSEFKVSNFVALSDTDDPAAKGYTRYIMWAK